MASGPGVYLLQADNGLTKIGKGVSAKKRAATIAFALPVESKLLHIILSDDKDWLEAHLHHHYREVRVRSEWFNLSKSDIAWLRKHRRWDTPRTGVAGQLWQIMKKYHCSHMALAIRSRLPREQLYSILNGGRGLSSDALLRLAVVLGVPVTDIDPHWAG